MPLRFRPTAITNPLVEDGGTSNPVTAIAHATRIREPLFSRWASRLGLRP